MRYQIIGDSEGYEVIEVADNMSGYDNEIEAYKALKIVEGLRPVEQKQSIVVESNYALRKEHEEKERQMNNEAIAAHMRRGKKR